ncbi:EamA family transporter [Xenorhabdus stockiae]|uniref:EamA family transporter n=1 Tax=Xenorhabdus stockiae TaxID=351614 RepID=UPI0040631F21
MSFAFIQEMLKKYARTLGWGAEVVISSYGMNKNIPADIAYFIRQLSSSLGYLIVIIIFIHSIPGVKYIFSSFNLSILLLAVSLTTTVSYLLYYHAIEKLFPIRAMALNITYSAWAIIFSHFIIGDPVSMSLLFTCIGVAIGSFFTAVNPRNIKIKVKF